jgi:hypothetical protein
MNTHVFAHQWIWRVFFWLLIAVMLAPATVAPDAEAMASPDAPETPLDTPVVVVNEYVDEYAISDGLLYWARKCWGGEFRGPGYLRRKPTHGGSTLTLQATTADNCYTFWHMNADASGVYYVNYETRTLDFRPTDDPTHTTSMFTFNLALNNDPISQLELSQDYIYWAAKNGSIYRLPKSGGSPVAIRSGRTGLRDIEQWADGQLYWLEDAGLFICDLPSCSTGTQVSTHTGNHLSSWLFYIFWVEQGSPQTIRYRACFLGCSETEFYVSDPAGSWRINRPSVGLCADGSHYCLYWQEYSEVVMNSRVRRKALEGGAGAETIADNIVRGSNPTETDDLGVYFLLSDANNFGLGRLPFTASVVQRDLAASAWEVTQGLQSLANDVPLAAGKTTYVRVYPDLNGSNANFVEAWLEGERGGVPLPGSPLAPLNGPFQMDDAWTYDRNQTDGGFLFQLPDSWITVGNIILRAVIDPRGIYADGNPANNVLTRTFAFVNNPPVCDIFIPVRTHTPAISIETPNFWRMIDLHKRIWPVPDVWVYYQTNDVAEPQVCWWGIIPYPCHGPFELNEGSSWDDWVPDAEEALLHIGTRAAFSDDPDECDDLDSAIHYIGMVHPDAPWGWGGLAYTKDWLQPASLVVMPPRDINPPLDWNWPWEGSTLAHETAHNHERKHVDCGNPDNPDGSYPYPVCAIDDTVDPTHYGFDINQRQPIAPEIASDVMSYNGRSQSATWQGRWISDYTYKALFNRIMASEEFELLDPTAPAATDDSVLVSALIDPVSRQGWLNPAWVYPTSALSSGLLEKWQAWQAENWDENQLFTSAVVSYHLRLKNSAGTVLADFSLTPLETEVHQDETYKLAFMQTFSAPTGEVTRLDLMADSTIIASLTPGAGAPAVTILQPAGDEVFDEQMTLRWLATDPDAGDRLHFNIQYSPDGGLSWKSVATNLPAVIEGNENILLLEDLGGLGASDSTTGLIRIAASDGYHTTLVDSLPFSVADQPPQPYIVSPDSTHYYQPGQAVPLRGGALDPESGGLSGSQLVWKIYGVTVGTGADTSLAGLAPGTYPLILEATDAAANVASKSAYLNITRLQIPLKSSLPVMDGLCEDPQYSGAQISLEPYPGVGQANVKLMRTAEALWACFGGMQRSWSSYDGYAGLRIDVDASRDAAAQTSDYGFFVTESGTPFTRAGNGSGGFDNPGPGGLSAQVSSDGTYWSAEMRIDASLVGGWDHPIGLELEQYQRLASWQRFNWPYVAIYNQPQTWAWTILGDLPVIESTAPESATTGGPNFTLTVYGEKFQNGAVVKWFDTNLPTSFVSSSQLTATVGTSLTGSGKSVLLTVRNPNSLVSDAVVFTVLNPKPVIDRLTPAGVQAPNPGFRLTVGGSGFVDGSQVLWNGVELATTFINNSSLEADVTAGQLAYASPVAVVVRNPQPAANQSEPFRFSLSRPGLYMPLVRR